MDFYIAKYKRQVFDGKEWKDTEYKNQNIVVMANTYYEAVGKIEKCLYEAERREYRAELVGPVKKCVGIVFFNDSDGCCINGIIEK